MTTSLVVIGFGMLLLGGYEVERYGGFDAWMTILDLRSWFRVRLLIVGGLMTIVLGIALLAAPL